MAKRLAARFAKKSGLIAVIGDEDTCTGLLLGGVGELNDKREPNFLVVTKDTATPHIEEVFRGFCRRTDIAIILVNQHVAEEIRTLIEAHTEIIPTVVIVPSKDHPYDPAKDPEMQRAKRMFAGDDFR